MKQRILFTIKTIIFSSTSRGFFAAVGLWCALAFPVLVHAVEETGKSMPAAKIVDRIDAQDGGVIGDGKTLNTVRINALIAELSHSGGGTLVFGQGTYLTGTVVLLSNVTLQLDAGATILGSTDIADYPENPPPYPSSRLEYGRYALISAIGQQNVAIKGDGRIFGQGDHPNFTKKDLLARGWSANDAYLKRPFGLSFIGCKRVKVEGIKLENIAFWCQSYLDCDDITVRSVTVDSKKYDYNNDGIDLDGCRNVRISDSFFFAGDDAICLKASYRDCENIVVTNCTASSLANGVKFGTASNFGFKNIAISNIVLNEVKASGIALEIVDGGTLDGVTLSNFTMTNVGAAIFIRLGNAARQWTMDQPKPGIGKLRNVSISHIVAVLSAGDRRPLCGSITGLSGHPVENITISDVQITSGGSHGAKESQIDYRAVPEVPEAYPEYSMFGPLPAYGLYVRHARGIMLTNVRFSFTKEDYRSAVVCDDVEQLRVSGLQVRTQPAGAPVIIFNDVRGAFVSGTILWDEAPAFLQLEGNSRNVHLVGNSLNAAHEVVLLSPPAEAATITP